MGDTWVNRVTADIQIELSRSGWRLAEAVSSFSTPHHQPMTQSARDWWRYNPSGAPRLQLRPHSATITRSGVFPEQNRQRMRLECVSSYGATQMRSREGQKIGYNDVFGVDPMVTGNGQHSFPHDISWLNCSARHPTLPSTWIQSAATVNHVTFIWLPWDQQADPLLSFRLLILFFFFFCWAGFLFLEIRFPFESHARPPSPYWSALEFRYHVVFCWPTRSRLPDPKWLKFPLILIYRHWSASSPTFHQITGSIDNIHLYSKSQSTVEKKENISRKTF